MRIYVLRSFIDSQGYATRGTHVDRPTGLARHQINRGFARASAKKVSKVTQPKTAAPPQTEPE